MKKQKRDKIYVLSLDTHFYFLNNDDIPEGYKEEFNEEAFEYIEGELRNNYMIEIDPVFNRCGYYYNRNTKKCWIETKYGSYQFVYPRIGHTEIEYFLYKMSEFNRRELNIEEYNLLKRLVFHYGHFKKEAKYMLRQHENQMRRKESDLESYKFGKRFK
jgi:hypothetical protein